MEIGSVPKKGKTVSPIQQSTWQQDDLHDARIFVEEGRIFSFDARFLSRYLFVGLCFGCFSFSHCSSSFSLLTSHSSIFARFGEGKEGMWD
jgi:hypothetical protein